MSPFGAAIITVGMTPISIVTAGMKAVMGVVKNKKGYL
jgi:hypothetical protein